MELVRYLHRSHWSGSDRSTLGRHQQPGLICDFNRLCHQAFRNRGNRIDVVAGFVKRGLRNAACLLVVEVVSHIIMGCSPQMKRFQSGGWTQLRVMQGIERRLNFVSIDRHRLVCDVENYDLFGHVISSFGPLFWVNMTLHVTNMGSFLVVITWFKYCPCLGWTCDSIWPTHQKHTG